MADIQNTRRKGLETWENAYKAVGKTKEEIQDLNSEFADFVANLNEFSDGTEVRFLDFLDNLDDVSKHWKEINEWIDQNSTKLDQFTGSLSNVRDIFRSITELVGGNRRQIADGYSIARKLENLAADSVSILDREGGLTERTVTNQIKKSQILRDQFKVRTESLAPEVDFNRLSQQDLDALKKKQNIQEKLQKEALKQLEFLKENRGDRKEIRALEEEIKLRQLNIEYLDVENIKAVKGLAEQLKYRKELWRQQRAGGAAAGENSQSIIPVNIAAKLLQKAGLVDQSSDLKDYYNEWVTRRIAALEAVDQAQAAYDEAEKSSRIELNNLLDRKNESLKAANALEEKLKENRQNLQEANANLALAGDFDEKELTEKRNHFVRENRLLEKELEEHRKKVEEYNRQIEANPINTSLGELNLAKQQKASVFADKFNFPKIIDSLGGIKSILTAIAGILAVAMFRQLLKFDEEAVKTKRVIGQWADASALANTRFVTGTEVLKTMRDLGEQFHINPVQVFSTEELGRIAQAQKLTGMTAQAAGNLAVQSKITGKNANTYRDEIAKGANQANRLNHSAVNLSAVQNDVLNTSRAIALSYGKNTEGLARAAGAAAALGMNLQDVENISKNLMNFESSIEAEMQAQLLTGMQLNLAKAREYALNNDLEGVTREIGRQGMDAAKFSHMNYIQQENMAKALGMSREQMSKMLIMQEINRGLTAEQVAAMTGMRRQDIEALSAQEKWQTMKQQFLESLVPLLEPILQVTSDILRLLSPIVKFVGWLAGQISTLFGAIPENLVWVRALSTAAIGIAVTIGVNWLRGLRGAALLGTRLGGIFTGLGTKVKGIGAGIGNWALQGKRLDKVLSKNGTITDPGRLAQRRAAYQRLRGKQGIGDKLGKPKPVNPIKTPVTTAAASGPSKMGKVFSSLGKNIAKIAIGAAAMGIMSLALIGIAKALQMLRGVEWKQFGIMAASIGLLAGTMVALGAIMMSGVGAALLGGGMLALGMLAVGMIAVGAALDSLGKGLRSLPAGTELTSISGGIRAIAGSVGELAVKLKDLQPKKLRALGKAFKNLKGAGIQIQTPIQETEEIVSQVSKAPESTGESKEIKRENIEAAVQTITIKQAQVQASAQQISVATDLSKIEQKIDSVVKAVVESRPDWKWLEFKIASNTNGIS